MKSFLIYISDLTKPIKSLVPNGSCTENLPFYAFNKYSRQIFQPHFSFLMRHLNTYTITHHPLHSHTPITTIYFSMLNMSGLVHDI